MRIIFKVNKEGHAYIDIIVMEKANTVEENCLVKFLSEAIDKGIVIDKIGSYANTSNRKDDFDHYIIEIKKT